MPGCGLKSGALICDHLDFDPTNDVPENLVPACNICNRHRLKSGKRAPISEDELYLVSVTSGLRTRATKKNCELCNKEFVVRISEIKIGRGRFCSMSCARRSRGRRKRD